MLPLRIHLLWIYYDKRDLIIAKRCAILFCVTFAALLSGLEQKQFIQPSDFVGASSPVYILLSTYNTAANFMAALCRFFEWLASLQQPRRRRLTKGMTESDSQNFNLRQFRQTWYIMYPRVLISRGIYSAHSRLHPWNCSLPPSRLSQPKNTAPVLLLLKSGRQQKRLYCVLDVLENIKYVYHVELSRCIPRTNNYWQPLFHFISILFSAALSKFLDVKYFDVCLQARLDLREPDKNKHNYRPGRLEYSVEV